MAKIIGRNLYANVIVSNRDNTIEMTFPAIINIDKYCLVKPTAPPGEENDDLTSFLTSLESNFELLVDSPFANIEALIKQADTKID